MDRLGKTAIMALSILLLAGCSSEQAPVGRWEGRLESSDWILAVRLQVEPSNIIRATALSVNVSDASSAERARAIRTMQRALPVQWETATSGEIWYEDNTLTRPFGAAPLFVFAPEDGSMTFNFYASGKLTKRVHLRPVQEFTSEAVN